MRFRDRAVARPFYRDVPDTRLLRATRAVGSQVLMAAFDTLEARRLLAVFSVDPNNSVSSTNFHTIADAIGAAAITAEEDDVVDVVAGSFTENVLINTPLSLRGAKFGQDPRSGRGAGETELTGQIAIAASGVLVDGFKVIGGAEGASAPSVSALYVNAPDAMVSNNILAGSSAGSGLLTGSGLTGIATLMQNVVSGFDNGANLVGNGTVAVTNSALTGNTIGIRIEGGTALVTLSQNDVSNNTTGLQIDLATQSGTSNVALSSNTLANTGAQIALLGGEAGDDVSLTANAVTLSGSATFINAVSATPTSGLSTTTFTLNRATDEDTSHVINLDFDATTLNPPDTTGLAGSVSVSGNDVTFTPTADFNGNTSFTFTTVGGASGTVNISVASVADAPRVTGDDAFSLSEGANYALTTDDTSASDPDLPAEALTYLIASVTGGQLELVSAPGVAITSFTPQQLAGGEVRYVHLGGEASSESVSYTVSDGSLSSGSRTIAITILPVNDAPVLSVSGPVTAGEGATSTVTAAMLLGTDVDNVAADLVFTLDALPAHGELRRDGLALAIANTFTQADVNAGLITYVHDGSETTSDSFGVTLGDGTATLPTGTVSISVTASNDPPVATNFGFATDEDQSHGGTLLGNDIDSASLTYSIVDQPVGGTVTITDASTGAFTFTPNLNYNGSTSFTFQVSDGTSMSNVATVSVTVNAINDAPVASNTSLNTDEDVALNGTLPGNDVDSSSLTYSIVDQPGVGTVNITDASTGAFTFTPPTNWFGTTTFTYQISDGSALSGVATVTIVVASVNDAPVASNMSVGTDEDIALSGTLLGNDIDSASLTYSIVDQPVGGTVTITDASTGAFTFTPNLNYNGSTSFTFQVSDGTSMSNVATVSVTVNAINDAPVASNTSLNTDEDVALNGTLPGNDVDSSSLTYSIVDQPGVGTVNITDASTGAFTFTPPANWFGTTTFTYQISDGSALSGVATVTIVVASVNDTPVASSIPQVTVDEGQSTTISLGSVFSDVDTASLPPDVLTYSLSGAPSFVSINPTTGVVTFAPGALDSGTYSFTAIATDGSSATASTGVSLVVNNVVNNPPVIGNLPDTVTVNEDVTGSIFDVNATDPDAGQSLIYSIIGGNGSGLFSIDPNTGIITLTGPLDAESATQFTLTIQVTDNGPPAAESSQANLVINVSDVNDLPTLVSLGGPSTLNEGSLATYIASASDGDIGAVLSYKWFVDDVEQVGETGSVFAITYTDQGSHVVRVEVSDRSAAAVSASKSTTVNDVSPTVPLSTSVGAINEGSSFSLNIGSITDPGLGDVAAIGQVAVWWQDGTFTLINESTNTDLLATLRSGGTVSVSHTYSDGQNAVRPITVSVFDLTHSYIYNSSIVVNNVAPTGTFAAITPSIAAGSSAFVNWFGQTDVSLEDRNAGLRYTYILDLDDNGVFNSGDVYVAGDGTYAGSSTASTVQIPGSLLQTAGDYSVLGLLIDKDSSPILSRTITINVTPSTLQVISLGGDHSGFTVVFNREIDLASLNLWDGTDTTNDTADVVLTRSTGQTIRGSLVLNSTRTGFDFLVTGGILSQGTYTVRMNSGVNAFKDLFGSFLDGDFNGTAGGNYIANFGVNAPPGPVLSTPDFSRGPNQPVDIIPGNANSDLPITMNSSVAVSSINFQLRYDQSLLSVSSVVAGSGLPAGWSVGYSLGSAGLDISLIKSSGTALDIPIGAREIVRVVASVPNTASIYGKVHVLSFASIVVNGNASIEGTADRSVHKVVFVGDANRDGTLNVGDASLIQSVVLNQVTGFDQYPLVDPVIIVDSSRNSAVDSQDASNAALSGFTGARPADVPAFTPVTVPTTIGVDPTYRLPTLLTATPGTSITVPLSVIDDARGIQSGQIRFSYDTNSLDLTNLSIVAGTLLGSGWQVLTNVNDAEGWVEVGFYSGTALAGASALTGTIINFTFDVLASAADGVSPLSISTPLNAPVSPTLFYNRQGMLLATGAESGSLLIDGVAPSVASSNFSFAGTSQSFTLVFSEDVSASITASDFELMNLTTSTAVPVVVSSISPDGKTVTLTFASTGGLTNAILQDGDYRLRVLAGQVADLAGRTNAANIDSTFFFKNADLNHDRTVSFDDLLLLAQNYGQTSGATFATGDVNYDGSITFDDLLALAQRYGTTLVAAAPKAAGKKSRFSDSVIS